MVFRSRLCHWRKLIRKIVGVAQQQDDFAALLFHSMLPARQDTLFSNCQWALENRPLVGASKPDSGFVIGRVLYRLFLGCGAVNSRISRWSAGFEPEGALAGFEWALAVGPNTRRNLAASRSYSSGDLAGFFLVERPRRR